MSYLPVKFVNFLKSRVIFNIFYCFWMFVINFSHISCAYISRCKRYFNVKSRTYYFHTKIKIIAGFQICISVPLTCMFYNRALNNRINNMDERVLRLVYQNKNLSFSELLELDNAVTIHQRNRQVLVTEIFKVKNNLKSPEIMKQVSHFQEPDHNLGSETSQLRRENIKATHYGIQSVKFLGPKIWAMVPQNIKNCKSLQEFKRLIKVWKPEARPCGMSKKYVVNIGFIWLNIHLS